MIQERIKETFESIKLPVSTLEEDRGYFRCCTPMLVLGDGSGDSWKNDKVSAWIKLSSPLDSATFVLKNGEDVTVYTPTVEEIINEANAFYTTIDWNEVLNSDGVGCYDLHVSYDISGITGTFIWGSYKLKPYSIENALTTCRVAGYFNSYQEIEGINFTGTNMYSTLRFNGFIGERKPNTEVRNLIYQNREVKKVVNENLRTWTIKSDPLSEDILSQLTELYLLSGTDLLISDYNAHNHSYNINDIPVVMEETPDIEYKELFRGAKLNAIVGDKFKNKRSYYV